MTLQQQFLKLRSKKIFWIALFNIVLIVACLGYAYPNLLVGILFWLWFYASLIVFVYIITAGV